MPVVLAPGAPDLWDWRLSMAGRDFYFACQPSANGVYAQIARPDGWDSPELRTDEQDTPLEWGADIGRVLFGKRILVLNGTLWCPDAGTLELVRRELLAALRSLDTDGLFEGNDDDGVRRYCRVRRSGKPQFTRVDTGVYSFTAQLVAGDPRKYSSDTSTISVTPSIGKQPLPRPGTVTAPYRYLDVPTIQAAVLAATTYPQITAALKPLTIGYDLAVNFHTAAGTGPAGITYAPIAVFADARQDAAWMVDEIGKYPPTFVRASNLATIHFAGDVQSSGTSVGGVAYRGDYYLPTIYNFAPDSVKGTFHHEFFHVQQSTWPADFTAMSAKWNAQNPPGFVYGTHPTIVGDHPTGFMEDYGRTNQVEDQATFAAARMGDEGWGRTNAYIAEDPRVAAKTALIVGFWAAHSDGEMADPWGRRIHVSVPNEDPNGPGTFPWARPFEFTGALTDNIVQLTNEGDLPTWLQIALVGPMASGLLLVETTGTGLRVHINADIGVNQVMHLDPANRTAMIDTTSYLDAFAPDSTPLQALQVPASTTTAWRLIAGGNGHALLTAADAWE